MSQPPETLPHLRPIAVEIPRHWTPEQALAVFDLLDELKERIWTLYSVQLQDLLQEQQIPAAIDESIEGMNTAE